MANNRKTTPPAVEETVAEETKIPESKEELVEAELFKDNGAYKDDVFVCVNGKPYNIKRGEKVKVPRSVKEVLDASKRQDQKTADMMQEEQDKFLSESKNR